MPKNPNTIIHFIQCCTHTLRLGFIGLAFITPSLYAAGVNVNQLVQDSAPAIVQVQGIQWVKVKLPEQYKDITSDPIYQSLSGVFLDPSANPKSAPVVKKKVIGTGFIFNSNGQVATNYQWIKGAHEIRVVLSDTRWFKASVVRSNAAQDLTILKINASDLPALSLAQHVEEGEGVIVVGYAREGVSVGVVVSTPSQTPSLGLVSDVSVTRNNSGGPLLNIYGQVLGISSTRLQAPMGLYRHPVLGKLDSDGFDTRTAQFNALSSIGFSAIDAPNTTNQSATGAWVQSVRPNSIAAHAGLRRHDVIIALESSAIINAEDLNALSDFLRQDNSATLRVLRDGNPLDLQLVAQHNTVEPLPWSWRRLGLRLRPLSRAQKDAAGINSGLQATAVTGSAENEGLAAGDWIVSANQTPLTSLAQFNQIAAALQPGDTIVLYVIRGDLRQFVTLTASPDPQ